MNRKRINRWTAVGEHPSETQLRSISLSDYKSVLNVRMKDEGPQPIPPHREEVMAKALGLAYRKLEIPGERLTEQDVERFRAVAGGMPRPVFVHGRDRGCLEALALVLVAVEGGWTGEKALEKADELGITWTPPELRDLVRSYVDRSRL
jgi:protein tyrosine phosphatase (PTP) superfamily phosphohydrolase (DUF442 family)